MQERIETLSFLLAIAKGKQMSFGDVVGPIASNCKEEDIKRDEKLLGFYCDIIALFEKLGIRKELDFDALSNEQRYALKELCQCELHNKSTHLKLKDKIQNIGIIRLKDINICCLYERKDDGKDYIYSVFRKKIEFEKDGKIIDYRSPYLLLAYGNGGKLFHSIDNINYKELIDSIKERGISEELESIHIGLLLEMLNYYDEEKAECIINAATELAEMIFCSLKTDEDLNFVNWCQCLKRQRALKRDEIDRIVQIKERTSLKTIKLACCVILESKYECQLYFNELSEFEQRNFLNQPISHLYAFND